MKAYEEILSEMENKFYDITGVRCDDATDIAIRFKVLAGQLFSLYAKCDFILREAFPQTASGVYLDYHAAERSVLRKEPTYASGYLTFYRDGESLNDIQIPEGTICSTGGTDAKRFLTTCAATLTAGAPSVTVSARAEHSGKAYNAGRGTVCVMVTPPQSIISVENMEAFSGGSDAEDDESLRRRLLDTYKRISNGANAAYYREVALRHSEIGDANVIPRHRGRGTVDVVVFSSSNTPASEQVLNEVNAMLQSEREVGVDVLAYNAVVMPIMIKVFVKAKTGYDETELATRTSDAITDFVDLIGIGKTVYIKELYSLLSQIEGMENFTLVSPLSDYEAPSAAKLSAIPLVAPRQ